MRYTSTAELAEEAVLSALLSDASLIGEVDTLTPEHFDGGLHGRIFAAILALASTGGEVTPITVSDYLRQQPGTDLGLVQLTIGTLLDAAPSSNGLREHAELIRRASAGRCLRQSLGDIVPVWERQLEAGTFDAGGAVAQIGPVLESVAADFRPRPSRFVDDDAIMHTPEVAYLVEGMLATASLAEMHGPPASGKSFVAIDLALSIAAGRPFCGRPVSRVPVVYVAPEGQAGLRQRVIAWKAQHQEINTVGVHFLPATVNLMDSAAVAGLIGEINRLSLAAGLIVFDTLHRSMPGGDENSAKDIGLVIANIDRIRVAMGACVLLVHHTRKDGDAERGSTSIRGAMDTMLGVRKEGRRLTITCEKQKDAEEFAPIVAELHPRDHSCVVITPNGTWEQQGGFLSEMEQKALVSLSRDFLDDGATATQWMAASGLAGSSFFRARTDLVRNGLAESKTKGRGARYVITPKGSATLTLHSQVTPIHSRESDRTSLPPKAPFLERAWDGSATGLKEAS